MSNFAGAASFDLQFVNGVAVPGGGTCGLTLNSRCRFNNVVVGAGTGSGNPFQRDVIITLTRLNDATLTNVFDNATPILSATPVPAASQAQFFAPTVTPTQNEAGLTSWAEFTFDFVSPGGAAPLAGAGTATLPGSFWVTSFDTDGDSGTLREFVEFVGIPAADTDLSSGTALSSSTAVDGGVQYQSSTNVQGDISTSDVHKASAVFSNKSSFKLVYGARTGTSGTSAGGRLTVFDFFKPDAVVLRSAVDGYKSVKLTTDADTSGTVTAGDTLTWTITYVNTGNAAVSNFQITDALPSNVTFTTGSQVVTRGTGSTAVKRNGYDGSGNLLTNTGVLGTNSSITVSIPVVVGTGATNTTLSNQASAGGVLTDNVDSDTVFPPSVGAASGFGTVPSGSVTQTELTTVNPTTVAITKLYAISGNVYEDYNYGGGAGRVYNAGQGMSLRPNVRVELYSSAGGNVLATAFTNASGAYIFTGQLPGTYKVRVVNSFVTSSRTGGCAQAVNVSTPPAGCTQIPVQTYINGSVNQVGGAAPAGTDPALSTTTLPVGAESVASVTISTADVPDVDFGFNFDTIVNTNDSGQGSLRQFVTNSNALLGNSSLVQVGQTAGKETSIFMVPTGVLTGGVAVINLASTLDVTDSNTSIDATTQTANTTTSTGDTNTGALGTGGLIGVDNLPLSKVDRPEVEITLTAAKALQISAANFTLRGVALHGGNQLVLGTGTNAADNALIEKNIFGTTAKAFTLPASLPSAQYGIYVVNGSGTILNNLIGYSYNSGINYLGGGAGLTIQNNEFQQSGYVQAGGDAITLTGSTTAGFAKPVTITGNLLASSNSSGIQFEIGSVANNTVTNNTITGNGKGGAATRLEGSGIHYLARNATVNSTNSDTITKNVIYNSLSSGVVVNFGQKNVTISQNSFYLNGLTSIDFTASDGYVGGNANYGKGNGVTPNDGATVAREGNTGQDYPVFTAITLGGGILDVTGYVGNGTSTSFDSTSAVIEIYKADDDGNQNGAVLVGDGKSVPHGEGKTYLGTLTVTLGAKGAFSGTLSAGAFTANDSLTATATIVGNTSEFSPNIKQAPRITLLKLGRNSTQNTAFVDQNGTVGAKPGETVEYCIAYSNAGSDALNFKLTDNVPVGMNALTDGYVVSKGVRWADGTVIAAGATATPTGSDLTSTDTDSDKGSLTTTLGLGKGTMTLDLGPSGLAAGGKGTVCFQAKVP
ncbi:beta strand repeat-containing protein [Deinococcus marmoris]|nr:right-handed parallel beta-helix repeat-containing protein [Deinococcus marmoris]